MLLSTDTDITLSHDRCLPCPSMALNGIRNMIAVG